VTAFTSWRFAEKRLLERNSLAYPRHAITEMPQLPHLRFHQWSPTGLATGLYLGPHILGFPS
jgi:hypothetical protein